MGGEGEAGKVKEGEHVREVKDKAPKALILDSSGIFHARDAHALLSLSEGGYIIMVTRQVLEEVKDYRSLALLEVLKPNVVDVDEGDVERIMSRARDLSRADASIVALASRLVGEGYVVRVVTDDVKLIAAIKRLRGVEVITVNVRLGKRR